jgi:hypothetical protein
MGLVKLREELTDDGSLAEDVKDTWGHCYLVLLYPFLALGSGWIWSRKRSSARGA